jgi:hypothetical protein
MKNATRNKRRASHEGNSFALRTVALADATRDKVVLVTRGRRASCQAGRRCTMRFPTEICTDSLF